MKSTPLLLALLAMLSCSTVFAQCTKDTECKGDRVCERGVCVAPATSPSAPRPTKAPKASETPRASAAYPKFEDFPVTKYAGQLVLPKGVHRESANAWRNADGKRIDPPIVNFAGKFSIILNSCGTGCRFHTLTDLSTGRNLVTLNVFSSTESEVPLKTKEGFPYVTDLLSRSGSSMLVAQYQVEARPEPGGMECRERVFVFENEKLRPITNTKRGCTSF